jgi:hypothetical protein
MHECVEHFMMIDMMRKLTKTTLRFTSHDYIKKHDLILRSI